MHGLQDMCMHGDWNCVLDRVRSHPMRMSTAVFKLRFCWQEHSLSDVRSYVMRRSCPI